MKNFNYLFLFIIFLTGCSAPFNISTIQNSEREVFEKSKLVADYDIYDLRIDLIRQEKDKSNDSTNKKEEVPLHPVGFYLGNGLFYDINDNLSLLVPELFHIGKDEDFEITQTIPSLISDGQEIFKRSDDKLIIERKGIFPHKYNILIEDRDSSIYIKKSALNDMEIFQTDSTFAYKFFLKKNYIYKDDEGYYINQLFKNKKYKQLNDTLYLGERYVIKNYGNVIEILSKGMFNSEYLLYSIIKLNNEIYIYNKKYYGYRITKNGNEIEVYDGKSKLTGYKLNNHQTAFINN